MDLSESGLRSRGRPAGPRITWVVLLAGAAIASLVAWRLSSAGGSSSAGRSASPTADGSPPQRSPARPSVPPPTTLVLAPESRPPGGRGQLEITQTCVRFDGEGGLVLGVRIANVSHGPVVLTSVGPQEPILVMRANRTTMGDCRDVRTPWRDVRPDGGTAWKDLRLKSGAAVWVSTQLVLLDGFTCLNGITYVLEVDVATPTPERLTFEPFGPGIGGAPFDSLCQH